jgi:PAS domain S-box-containing protein
MEKHTTISFQNIVEHAPLGMIVIGLDERLILANRCMRAILGLEVGELDSLTLSNITHPEENSLYRECFRRLQNFEPTVSFDARCLHKQGHACNDWLLG